MKGLIKGKGLLAAFLCTVLLCGCGQTAAENVVEEPSKGAEIQIGMSIDSFVIERWIRDRDVFVSTAQELGAEVNVQCASGDVQEQIDQIRYLIEKKVDVLVVIPVDCNALSDVLKDARNQGIKIISYDRLVANSNVDLYISFDNEQVGRLMGQSLVEALPDGGEIFMIGGPTTDNNVGQVEKGFHEVIDASPLEVVYTQRCENWNAAQAYGYVKSGLSLFPDVAAIMCGNDDIATQTFQALSEERLAGKVYLTGQDGDLMACQRVVQGTQLVSVFKAISEEAREAADYAVRLAKGEELTDITTRVDDGTFQVPAVILMPVAVTKDNLDEVIIEGGYHARDEVYSDFAENTEVPRTVLPSGGE
ncbi:MAG: substrate-binding domain-containing protein [Lachnospiraceae bacterium]|nr:substrate-binding domain-containing protein [Lachnospiraceae bacterium]